MGRKKPYVPSIHQLLDARIERVAGNYDRDTYLVDKQTYYTVTIYYAGHKLKFHQTENEHGEKRLRRRPKKPAGLIEEDLVFLNHTAAMLIKAYQKGIEEQKQARAEETALRDKAAAADFLHELSQDKEIGTGSDKLEKMRQTSFISSPEEDVDE